MQTKITDIVGQVGNLSGLQTSAKGDLVDAINEVNSPAFTQASTRENVSTEEALPVLFGKIQKFFADLKTVAFTGNYSDLNEIPDRSYVGMVIHSTTFDTEAKVIAWYGGSKWILHSGYVLRGASSGVTANDNTKTGGNDSVSYTPAGSNAAVTLTAAQCGVPAHSHGLNSHTHSVSATTGNQSADHTHGVSASTGYESAGHTHSVSATTGGISANHTHSIPALSGTAASAGAHEHSIYQNGKPMIAHQVWNGDSNSPTGMVQYGTGGVYPKAAENGSHTHSVTTNASTTGTVSSDHTHSFSTTSGGVSANHYHSFSTTSGGVSANHTHSFSTTSGAASGSTANNTAASASESHNHTFTGTAATINTLPAYKSVYIWERVS